MKNTNTKIILHGHFYQPPREDPWTNEIDNQSSAYPFKNWNYKIAAECYGPNAYSRVLDEKGMIQEIVNNYEYLSFNFGPTLLNWLENKEPEIYNRILDADKQSVTNRNGHGNAIAQIYNHIIMPLASFEDKITEVLWGLKDFEYRFGRKSEGIWLSETAVDYKTIDILIEQNIKFIILSPLQAQSIRKIDQENWIPLTRSGINSTVPYLIRRTHGDIAVFFYDKNISTAISFEHLLRNSDDLANKLCDIPTSDNGAVIVASDGEIYGHHEPFGDMCVSSLISHYHKQNKSLQFTNFGELLENCPPTYEVNLFMGDDGLGSSWSCSHGVGRWYKNCGCKTGGESYWTQEWRTPIRNAFNLLKNEADRLYFENTKDFVDNPWDVRNSYIDFILSEYHIDKNENFIKKHLKREITNTEKEVVFRLLEVQKLCLFSFTSCGWFFSEVTGVETVQNIKFAAKALALLEESGSTIRSAFLEILEKATSNIHDFHNARQVFENWIQGQTQDKWHIANNFIALLLSNVHIKNSGLSLLYSFDYRNFKIRKKGLLRKEFNGEITIIDKTNNLLSSFKFSYAKKTELTYNLRITENNNSLNYNGSEIKTFTLSEKDLLCEVKNIILENNSRYSIRNIYERNAASIENIKSIMKKYVQLNINLSVELSSFVKNTVEIYLHKISEELETFPDEKMENFILSLFELINESSIKIDALTLKNKLSEILYKSLSETTDTDADVYSKAIHFIEFTNKAHIIFEKSKLENRIYNILKSEVHDIIHLINQPISENQKVRLMLKARRIILLAEIFNINTNVEKKTFFAYF